MNYIFYNSKQIEFPTPLVSLSQENISYNRDWARNVTINLEGQLTGDYENIRRSQSGLLNIFDKNFGSIEIYEATGWTGFNLNLTSQRPVIASVGALYTGFGGYIPKYSNLTVRIDGGYGGYPLAWQRSKDNAVWTTFTLYKTHYYSGENFTTLFNPSFLSPQSSPYINIPLTQSASHNNLFAQRNNPSVNARGIYTGNIEDYNYFRILINGPGGGNPTDPQVNLIVSGFNADKIYEKDGIIIRSINFEESPYFGIVNYNIELNSIKSSGNVLEPRNEFSFSEDEQRNLRLSHGISARGLNTSSSAQSNALQNAITFVRSCTGLNNIPAVRFISGYNNKFYLQSISESINRLNAIYSIQEEYSSNLINTGYSGVLNYTINVNSGAENNSVQVDIRGTYKGSLYGDINLLRNSLDAYTLVTGSYSGYVNPTPIQYSITENTGENSISFDYSFDNINLPNPYYKYDGTISKNELDQIINIQARGEMVSRGNLKYRSSIIDSNVDPLTSGVDVFASGLLSGYKYINNIATDIKLRRNSLSINKNKNDGTLNIDINYDDKYLPSGDFIDASYNINVSAPYWYMNNQATCNIYGYHIINDFDVTTLPKVSLNINAFAPENSLVNENSFKNQVLKISSGIIPNNYNFSKTTSEDYNINKKYNNLNSIYDISYNINKVATDNQNGLLPKFDVII